MALVDIETVNITKNVSCILYMKTNKLNLVHKPRKNNLNLIIYVPSNVS